jgi:hypothetical protein
MNRTKEELLLECVRQFEHIENVLGCNRLSTTKSLINEINQALRIHDVSMRSEQLKAFNKWFQENAPLYDYGIDETVIEDYLKSL